MIYVVQQGDSLSQLAQTYGVSVARLRSDNGLLAEQPLVPGQALVILIPQETYLVQPGDTLYSIAVETGISLLQLLRNNPTLAQGQPLAAGEVLTIRLEGEGNSPLAFNGYAYPHIQQGVLRQALPFLTDLSIFSYGFREDGTLVVPDDSRLLAEAALFGLGAVLVLTSIDESGTFSTQRASQLFQNQNLQDQVLDSLLGVMLEKGYLGLDADFEYIEEKDREAFFRFLGNARDRLHQYGLFLHVDLAPKTSAQQPGLLYAAHDYGVIGAIADSVLLMTYEWGYAYGPPMAVAPLPQVEAVLRYGITEIPAWKIQMGIPNYGYDWILPYEQGRRATTVGNQEAVLLAALVGAEIQFDPVAQAPNFQYTRAGEQHQVWFEDARSIQAKLRLARDLGLAGGAYWNLLRPFAQNWALLSQDPPYRRAVDAG
ncbi:MAG: LysM peptidoglycan-binding domain-containing protein [Evtepia sp.]|nr:LysM peptidoglycan-binding domain-containing protein [Evtepia sp.]